MYALFLTPYSRHNFEIRQNTTKGCTISASDADLLKWHVKMVSKEQGRHPNSVWADLKKRYDFYSYKEIDCHTMVKIKKDLNLDQVLSQFDYIQ